MMKLKYICVVCRTYSLYVQQINKKTVEGQVIGDRFAASIMKKVYYKKPITCTVKIQFIVQKDNQRSSSLKAIYLPLLYH